MNPVDALDRLVRADPFPGGLPAPPLKPVLRRLDEQQPAAAQQSVRRGSGLRYRPLRAVVAVTGVLVAVAVVVVAMGMLGRQPVGSPSVAGLPGSHSLLSQFAILRRPQSAGDRQVPRAVPDVLGELPQRHNLLPSLTRVVGVLPGRAGPPVLLLVIAHGRSAAHPRDLWLMMAFPPSPRGGGSVAGSPYSPRELFPQIGDGYATGLVPDAVKRVKWVFPGRTVYPTIRHNVAVAPASIPPGSAPPLKSATWYGAAGRVLAYEDQATFTKRQAVSERPAIAHETPWTPAARTSSSAAPPAPR